MRRILATAALLGSTFAIPAHAVTLLAIGSLNAASDKSGLTGTLENGLPANIFGGIGSGLAYAGGNRFIALPDRGPNATPYNSGVDDTVSYISRFHELTLSLSESLGGALPFTLGAALNDTTLMYSNSPLIYGNGIGFGLPAGNAINTTPGQYYFSGRSDNFGAGISTMADFARFDPESIRISNDGKSVFISDEYGPYVRQFDRETGALIKTFDVPGNLAVSTLSPNGETEISGNTSGRTANKGMEGLALTPDGKTLVGIMQAPSIEDAAVKDSKKIVKIVTIDIATGATHEYAYKLTTGSGVSEIVAINDHQFLIDERDGKGLGDGSAAVVKQIFTIDIAGATDVTNLSGAALAAAAVTKSATPFLDLVQALTAFGIPATQIPAKIEGMAFGQDVVWNGQNYHTLYIANDNDFLPDAAGDNKFYVFGFTDAELPGYVAQAIAPVPEASTWAMMLAGFGAMGVALRNANGRRRRKVQISFA